MEKTNLLELWKLSRTQENPLLGTTANLSQLPFMEEYLANTVAFDRNIAVQRGMFAPIWNRQFEDSDAEVLTQWRKDAFYYLLKNKENYTRLYTLMHTQYTPLENYNRVDERVIEEDGSDTTTDNIGRELETANYGQDSTSNAYAQKTQTDNWGAKSKTTTIGGRQDSTAYGAKSTTNTFGQQVTTVENDKMAYDSADYVHDSKDTHNNGAHTDGVATSAFTDTTTLGQQSNSDSEAAFADTHSVGQHTDTATRAAHTDTLEKAARANTSTIAYGKETTDTTHSHGNIGVTTNEKMANDFIKLWDSFRFYDILIGDLCKELCTFYDEGYDCF